MGLTKNILVPTDFSEGSGRAIHFATAMAAETNATIHLVHTYEIPVMVFVDGSMIATPNILAKLSDAAQWKLDGAAAQIREAHVEVAAHLLQGVPHAEITRSATELGCDLIVMSTHGRTGLAHIFVGSVAERVVRTAAVPVLTLRAGAA